MILIAKIRIFWEIITNFAPKYNKNLKICLVRTLTFSAAKSLRSL